MSELTTNWEFLEHWRPTAWPKATWTDDMRADSVDEGHCSLGR